MFDPDDFEWDEDERRKLGWVFVRLLQLIALLLWYGIMLEAMVWALQPG